jgi:hypothetical protein
MRMKSAVSRLISCLLVAGLLIAGCKDDPRYRPTGPVDEAPQFENLQDKDDVLYNLALAYNKRNTAEFEKLLDENFVFVFSQDDFNHGIVDVQQWGREAELEASRNIFDPNFPADYRVVNIDLTLNYPEDSWVQLPPDEDHPDESWYTKTVDYNLIIKTHDGWEHRAIGLQAQFTIRWGETEGGEHWQIVLWGDDVGSSQALSPGSQTVASSTWGAIKAKYSVPPKKDQRG